MPKIIHYRNKCIGCAICWEVQPEFWRMSRKDGRATLVGGEKKKDLFILPIINEDESRSQYVAEVCPVNVIKVV